MIAKVKKILFLGPQSEKFDILYKLQKLGIVQLEKYKGEGFQSESVEVDSIDIERSVAAMKVIKEFHVDKEFPCEKAGTVDVDGVIDKIISLDKDLLSLKEESIQLKSKHEDYSFWGRFSLSDIVSITNSTGVVLQFWELAVKNIERLILPDGVRLVEINHDAMTKYFMTFSNEHIHLDGCIEEKFDEDIFSIEDKIKKNNERQHEIVCELTNFMTYKDAVYRRYLSALNNVNYKTSLSYMIKPADGLLYAFQGWIPAKNYQKLVKSLDKENIYILEVSPDPDERIPTFIANKSFGAMGQDLVEFYDTPSAQDWDPSWWVFLSFTVFFSMILGDGGYGLLLFLIMLYFRIKKRKSKTSTKRFLNMAMVLTFSTFVYGIISGGFFSVAETNPVFGWILKYKLFIGSGTDKAVINNMMRVSVLIGIIHISLSMMIKTLKLIISERSFIVPLSYIAWIVIIWTFFFYYGSPFMGIESKLPIQKNIMIGCAAVVFLTSAGSFNPVKIFFGGLLGLYNGVQFFSDVLSYIRIFALGLSGAIIGQIFNGMASDIMSLGYWAIPLAVIIGFLGHLLNIMLCIMGAVIHGLRLNFLEFYRCFFVGGGKPFKPLKDLLSD